MSKFTEITIVDLNPQANTGKFQLKKGFDFEAVLADLAKTNAHIEGWSKAK